MRTIRKRESRGGAHEMVNLSGTPPKQEDFQMHGDQEIPSLENSHLIARKSAPRRFVSPSKYPKALASAPHSPAPGSASRFLAREDRRFQLASRQLGQVYQTDVPESLTALPSFSRNNVCCGTAGSSQKTLSM
jgi:hypothetical protein